MYDASAPTEECDDYSGCDYQGEFAYYPDVKSIDFVKTHNLVAFFKVNNPNLNQFYGGKTVRLVQGSVSFEATIVDTCGDSDCTGCCTKNAREFQQNYLIDIEYYTLIKYFGDPNNLQDVITFQIFA